jgi:hypothetical protein
MKFIQLTKIDNGLPLILRTDCITHIRQLPAGGSYSARTVIFTGNDRSDEVTETAEEIQRLMEGNSDNEGETFADNCDPFDSFKKYIKEVDKRFGLANRRITQYFKKINRI